VKRPSYQGALDELLIPLGFERPKARNWVRKEGGLIDHVDIQTSSHGGTTANLHFNDENTWALLTEAVPTMTGPYFMNTRLWSLTGDPYVKWWQKGDPNGPTDVVWALRQYGLPLFDQLRSLEFQTTRCGPLFTDERRHAWSQIWLAMTLYRMGDHANARRVISEPTKSPGEHWAAQVAGIRRWVEAKTASG
jgi:hypothetical protein